MIALVAQTLFEKADQQQARLLELEDSNLDLSNQVQMAEDKAQDLQA